MGKRLDPHLIDRILVGIETGNITANPNSTSASALEELRDALQELKTGGRGPSRDPLTFTIAALVHHYRTSEPHLKNKDIHKKLSRFLKDNDRWMEPDSLKALYNQHKGDVEFALAFRRMQDLTNSDRS